VRIEPKPAPPRPPIVNQLVSVPPKQQQSSSPLRAQLEALLATPEQHARSKRAADLASSRAGLAQSTSLTHLIELDQTARELADMDYLDETSSEEDDDLKDDLDLMQPDTWEETHAEAEAARRRDDIAQTARKAAAERARAAAQLRTDLAVERAAAAAAAELERKHEGWAEERAKLIATYRRVRDIDQRYIPAKEWAGPIQGMAFKFDEMFGLGYYPDDLALRYYDPMVATQAVQHQVLRSLRQRCARWIVCCPLTCNFFRLP
jgi:hypothetical protein